MAERFTGPGVPQSLTTEVIAMLMERKARRAKASTAVALTAPQCPHCAAVESEMVALHDANEWLREVAVDALVRADRPGAKWRAEREILLSTISRLQEAAHKERCES